MQAIATRSAAAPALVALAGLLTSVGPCVAPRFIAVAGLSAGRGPAAATAIACAFVAGLAAAYSAFGAISSLLGRFAVLSHAMYWAIAGALLVGGCASLWKGAPECGHASAPKGASSFGGAFLLGASFAFVVSPCCTPLLLAILAYSNAMGDPAYGSLLLASLALGHAAPVLAVGLGASATGTFVERLALKQGTAVVSAALMLALAGYYLVLA
ncbi:MAG: cytochrome c biogenesis protein CcdA [Candidatus Eremiobacteraeota bacterium]|nr:cytochrome c biogenesis protein CcdA [Candidatus Eremiobacteraeota bacterium]